MTQPRTHSQGPDGSEVPDWKLERFLIGELPEAEAGRIEVLLTGDPALAQRLEALISEHQALKAGHPAQAMAQGIAARLRHAEAAAGTGVKAAFTLRAPSWLRLPRPRVWGPAFAMLMVLALLPFTPYSPFVRNAAPGIGEGGSEGPATERLKGHKPRLLLHRKVSEGTVRVSDGEAARSGDLIQIQYESAGRTHGAILSLDAEGKVTRHHPETGARSATLQAGGPVALGFAYELDDSPGWERFYFVTSDAPFDLAPVEEALRKLRPGGPGVPGSADSLPLPNSIGQTRFVLLKEPGT
jgi:hypothetical protein